MNEKFTTRVRRGVRMLFKRGSFQDFLNPRNGMADIFVDDHRFVEALRVRQRTEAEIVQRLRRDLRGRALEEDARRTEGVQQADEQGAVGRRGELFQDGDEVFAGVVSQALTVCLEATEADELASHAEDRPRDRNLFGG